MIQKEDFYHGAALVRLLDDSRFQKIKKQDCGYLVDDEVFVFLKYRTKSRSPWQFGFSDDEVMRLNSLSSSVNKIVVVLICGGDGICAVLWEEIWKIVGDGNEGGWISVRRNFNECYAVAGSKGELSRKVSFRRWPLIVFGSCCKSS